EIFELSQLKENEQICIVMNKKEVHRALRHTFIVYFKEREGSDISRIELIQATKKVLHTLK
ncbi:hypothetical protein, partial [Bacteroides stercoris]|uniref:hypothetical protein n=1 Tax=Bacteroides stercoris TaxID=46506 RepID=UPI0008983BBE